MEEKKTIKLPETVKTNSRVYDKVYETPKGYVFKCRSNDFYEAFYKKGVRVCLDFKKRLYDDTTLKHRYPKNEDFGKWAWTTNDLERAKSYIEL